ncbi:MAG: hypothetical protein M0042_03975 [Nitrospiraceae bacterium]|nr:hypothetical protein [Nitrospiraceae bacterium]
MLTRKNGGKQLPLLLVAALLVLAAAFSSGCAEKGPVLLQDMGYRPAEGAAAPASKIIAGVAPFRDLRGAAPSIIGKRVIREYIENDLVVQGTVSDIVTAATKSALQAQGIAAKDVPAWDLNAETASTGLADLVIGGEIKSLWVDVLSQPLNVKTRAVVQLRVAVADGQEKKILRTLNLSSTIEREDVSFSFENVQGAVSEALTAALNQLLNDDEFKKRIQ